ncbi:MAG: universal stress protein [Candidatus Methanoperedens sp.]|nr:universal stress protein [Candidatus Methanoperedens sp.]
MFKKVLVPVKATRGSEKAIDVACDLAAQLDAGVHILTVNIEGMEDKLTGEMMEEFVSRCRSKGIEATHSMLTARRPEDVARTIAEASNGYDIIVMGHCKYKKIYRFLHSSVAEDVIQLTSCPVLVTATDCLS